MKRINNYILEKLSFKKGMKVDNTSLDDPFNDVKFEDGEDLLNHIVSRLELDSCGEPEVWNDTGKYDSFSDFENFTTTYGTYIDWVDSFSNEVDNNMVAIWEITKNRQANIENHPYVKYFQKYMNEETLYKCNGYFVKYWGDYEYRKNIIISMIIATPNEAGNRIIAFIVKNI